MRTWIAVVVLATVLVWWLRRARPAVDVSSTPARDASARLLEEALGVVERT